MTKNNGYGFPAASQVREELFTIGLLLVNDLVHAYIQESSGEQGQALSNCNKFEIVENLYPLKRHGNNCKVEQVVNNLIPT